MTRWSDLRIPSEVQFDWRLNEVPEELVRQLGYTGRRALDPNGGFNIPCFDPDTPDRITGFIRQNYGQHFYYLATGTRGISARQDIWSHGTDVIVLVENPLLALWLSRRDVRCVVLIVDPAQLDGHWDMFQRRKVVVANQDPARAHRWASCIRKRCPEAGAVTTCILPKRRNHVTIRMLAQELHQEVAYHPPFEPVPPATPAVIADLVKALRKRWRKRATHNTLHPLGLDALRLQQAFGIIVAAELWTLRMMHRDRIRRLDAGGHPAIVPAWDADDQMVDALIYPSHARTPGTPGGQWRTFRMTAVEPGRRSDRQPAMVSLHGPPCGVVMTKDMRRSERCAVVHVVDHRCPQVLEPLWTAGHRHLIIARGVADVAANVLPALRRRCVERVHLHGAADLSWATVVRDAGYTVEVTTVRRLQHLRPERPSF